MGYVKAVIHFCVFALVTLSLSCSEVLSDPTSSSFTRDKRLPQVEEHYFEFQTLDHYDRSNAIANFWRQRYFANSAYRRPGGPVFLMLGGMSTANPVWLLEGAMVEYARAYGALVVMLEHRYHGMSRPVAWPGGPVFQMLGGMNTANPVWLLEGAMVEYARTYGALMVMLEHRYHGNSRPVANLTVENLRHLSSHQALADIAKFIPQMQVRLNVTTDTRIILFGGGYAGALATWFRSKYPYFSHGAVATSPSILASSNFGEYLHNVADTLDTVNPRCRDEIRNATTTMYEWWGQPDKRVLMRDLFRLCDKIDHSVMIDVAAFFYMTAINFARGIVDYNKVNRTLQGLPDGTYTMTDACDAITGTWGNSVERYAKVQTLVLDVYKRPCLDARFYAMMEKVNMTQWDRVSANGGRQRLYQVCTEFGWDPNSMSKQPFGGFLQLFPVKSDPMRSVPIQSELNIDRISNFDIQHNYKCTWSGACFTADQCAGAFGEDFYDVGNMYDNCEETNRMYGGLDMTVSNVVIVNGDVDPWRTVSATAPLKNSPGAEVILIPGTSHMASMYPSASTDPPSLVQARARISDLIRKWLTTGN